MSSIGTLGANIKKHRTRKGLTINDLAKATGLTSSYISQVERAAITPSLKSLVKISEALELPLISFFSATRQKKPVTRKGKRKHILLPNSNIQYELLSPSFDFSVEFLLGFIEPHQASGEEFVSHHGEECIFILTGKLQVEIGKETYLLEEGDSIQFDADVEHRLTNPSNEKVVMVIAESPPSF
jgi:transcriptional regulator with XRE-family HTH domain